MADINIQQIDDAGPAYSLVGKKVMVHDDTAPLATSTVLVPAEGIGGRAPMWKQADGDMTAGLTTFTHADLVGMELNYIIVNKVIEFIGEDYTFNPATGEIDRSPNQWQVGDKMITPYKLQ